MEKQTIMSSLVTRNYLQELIAGLLESATESTIGPYNFRHAMEREIVHLSTNLNIFESNIKIHAIF